MRGPVHAEQAQVVVVATSTRTKNKRRRTAKSVGIVLLAFLLGAMVTRNTSIPAPMLMPCPEDAVIVGMGTYTSDGYWSRYVCVSTDSVGRR